MIVHKSGKKNLHVRPSKTTDSAASSIYTSVESLVATPGGGGGLFPGSSAERFPRRPPYLAGGGRGGALATFENDGGRGDSEGVVESGWQDYGVFDDDDDADDGQ